MPAFALRATARQAASSRFGETSPPTLPTTTIVWRCILRADRAVADRQCAARPRAGFRIAVSSRSARSQSSRSEPC